MIHRAAIALFLLSLCLSAGAQPFLTARDVDLVKILPPPPLDDSAQTRSELAEVLAIQATRTVEMVSLAQADSDETAWRFANVFGSRFAKESLPLTGALFERLHLTEGAIVDAAKAFYKRPRPYVASDQIHPVAKLSKSPGYPSGHATGGTLMGIALANMVPENGAKS